MKLKDMTEEQRAVIYARTRKHVPGAFSYMVQHHYLTRHQDTKAWQLNSDGQSWLAKWENWKP